MQVVLALVVVAAILALILEQAFGFDFMKTTGIIIGVVVVGFFVALIVVGSFLDEDGNWKKKS